MPNIILLTSLLASSAITYNLSYHSIWSWYDYFLSRAKLVIMLHETNQKDFIYMIVKLSLEADGVFSKQRVQLDESTLEFLKGTDLRDKFRSNKTSIFIPREPFYISSRGWWTRGKITVKVNPIYGSDQRLGGFEFVTQNNPFFVLFTFGLFGDFNDFSAPRLLEEMADQYLKP